MRMRRSFLHSSAIAIRPFEITRRDRGSVLHLDCDAAVQDEVHFVFVG
jgi:hypothetical protein